MNTRFVLLNTSHAGNIGAAARAMKVMGFHELVLVAPCRPDVLRSTEAMQRASGALDVLEKARVVDTLEEALDGIAHLCATAMTPRDFGPPTRSPRSHFEALLACPPAETPPSVGLLFGSERWGMRNQDVYRCHACLRIPAEPDFGSLNLGAAVQVIAYEWRLALAARSADLKADQARQPPANAPRQADARQVAGALAHWEHVLAEIGFLDPAVPRKLMPRLNQLLNRAQLTEEEIHILRGIAKATLQAASQTTTKAKR